MIQVEEYEKIYLTRLRRICEVDASYRDPIKLQSGCRISIIASYETRDSLFAEGTIILEDGILQYVAE